MYAFDLEFFFDLCFERGNNPPLADVSFSFVFLVSQMLRASNRLASLLREELFRSDSFQTLSLDQIQTIVEVDDKFSMLGRNLYLDIEKQGFVINKLMSRVVSEGSQLFGQSLENELSRLRSICSKYEEKVRQFFFVYCKSKFVNKDTEILGHMLVLATCSSTIIKHVWTKFKSFAAIVRFYFRFLNSGPVLLYKLMLSISSALNNIHWVALTVSSLQYVKGMIDPSICSNVIEMAILLIRMALSFNEVQPF